MRHLRLVENTEEHAMNVKIAFATSDRRAVNQHFGAAESFAIYEVGESETRLIEVAEFIDFMNRYAERDADAAGVVAAARAAGVGQVLLAGSEMDVLSEHKHW